MKKYLVVFAFLILTGGTQSFAQFVKVPIEKSEISIREFFDNSRLNDLSMSIIFRSDDSFSQIKNMFGEPINVNITESDPLIPDFYRDIELIFNGCELTYFENDDTPFMFTEMVVNSSHYTFYYEDLALQVGTSIDDVRAKFPNPYKLEEDNMRIKSEHGVFLLTIYFSDNQVTSFKIWQSTM